MVDQMVPGEELSMFSSLEQLVQRLRGSGYIADSIATTTVYLAARLQKPLLLEGIRTAKYTVDGGARGMREVFRSVSWPPRLWA
jgi:hypothetical protein